MGTAKPIKSSFILGISLIIAFTIFGFLFYKSRVQKETVSVIGSATQRHIADIVKWRVTIVRSADINDLKTGYSQLQKDMSNVLQLFKTNGIDEKNVTIHPIETDQRFDRNGQQTGYNLRQSFFVISSDIPKVEKMALNPNFILEKNVQLQSASLEYYFSKLPDIKRELIAEAIQDARKRADTIAQNSGSSIKKLENAHTGIFQINEPYSTEVSYGGVYNTSTREKDITITIDATYAIK